MKGTILTLTYIVGMITCWLFFSLFLAFFANISYISALRCEGQIFMLVFFYLWLPIIPVKDIEARLDR